MIIINDLNLTDYKVLAHLLKLSKEGKGVSKFKSATIGDIYENMNVSDVTIRKSTEKLIKNGLIEYGIKQGRSKTYYINLKGVKELEDINKSEVENYE